MELRRVRLPLVEPFATGHGIEAARDTLLVRVETSAGPGWGECAALPTPGYSSEYTDGAQHVVRHHLAPLLFATGNVDTAHVTRTTLAPVAGHPMAKAALEMALLDAELRAAGRSLAQHLGATRTTVTAGVAVGLAPSIDELVQRVSGHVEAGYRRVKLKIQPRWDVEPVAAVRSTFGDDLLLQVDANAAYTLADADHLSRLDAYHLVLIEQPLPADDLCGHAELARCLATPVCLDETITSATVAADAIALGACEVVNVKPGRVGGYLEAKRVHDVCVERGVPAWVGGMLETGLARAANLALAALPGFTLPGDVSASRRWFERDLTITPAELNPDGTIDVPTTPGIGATPDPTALDEFTVAVEWVPRPG
jgi:O-succinylbenzoate synthase